MLNAVTQLGREGLYRGAMINIVRLILEQILIHFGELLEKRLFPKEQVDYKKKRKERINKKIKDDLLSDYDEEDVD